MKLVDVYWGGGTNGDAFLQGIYKRLAGNPPEGWTVRQHKSAPELFEHIASADDLQALEIVAHGNPFFLGAITLDQIVHFQNVLKGVSSPCRVYLSGCNTGTFAPGDKTNLGTKIAAGVPGNVQVVGSRGYLNEYTVAEGKVECSPDDWGDYADCVYGEAIAAGGEAAFIERRPLAALRAPGPQMKPVITPAQQTAIDGLLAAVVGTPSEGIPINPRTGPDFTASYHGQPYEFLCGMDIAREASSGSTWRVAITDQSYALLRPLLGFG